jgi:hypothetical protein
MTGIAKEDDDSTTKAVLVPKKPFTPLEKARNEEKFRAEQRERSGAAKPTGQGPAKFKKGGRIHGPTKRRNIER